MDNFVAKDVWSAIILAGLTGKAVAFEIPRYENPCAMDWEIVFPKKEQPAVPEAKVDGLDEK